jgi:hypothetical protein
MQRLFRNLLLGVIALALWPLRAEAGFAQDQVGTSSIDTDKVSPALDELNVGRAPDSFPAIAPISEPSFDATTESVVKDSKPGATVNWKGLTRDSLVFLTAMHAFRLATEPGTRAAFSNPFFKGYIRALENVHGWSDGDPVYVNYVGHPMQGAVSGYIWANNDRAYKDVYFGRDKRYWKQKLRGVAFSALFSAQFEIGPVSEASIGNVQSYYPAQGFVDHVVTPAIGLGWSIGEDVLDRYLIRYIESRTNNYWFKLLARGGLNPSHTFANFLGGKAPWDRTNRPGVLKENSADYYQPIPVKQSVNPPVGEAPFEFNAVAVVKTYLGSGSHGSCLGGGAGLAFRLAKDWQLAGDVNGCKMSNLHENLSGDSLTYVAGPRWSNQISPRWNTHAQFLVGGNKITHELIDPAKQLAADQRMKDLTKQGIDPWPPPYAEFAQSWDSNALAIVCGAGLDVRFNHALLLRTALGYSHTWNQNLNDFNYRNSLQFSSGLVLNMGTW